MLRIALLLMLLPTMLFAQVYEELTVTYKDIRVHVIDENGEPVKGLKLEDFIVKERRDLREPSYFEEVDLAEQVVESDLVIKPGEKSGESRPVLETADTTVQRYIVLFIDSSHMTQGSFNRVKNAMADFIDQKTDANDNIKIVQSDRGFQHLTGFTNDKLVLKDAIQQAGYFGQQRRDIRRIQTSINRDIEEWDLAPQEQKSSYETIINQQIREKARIKADYFQTFRLNMFSVANMLEYIKGAKSIFLFSGGGYTEFNSTFADTAADADELGRVLNRANATIYTMLFTEPNPLAGSNTLNLRNSPPGFARSLDDYSTFPPDSDFSITAANTITEDTRQRETAPATAAETTGGLFLRTYNANDAVAQIAKVDRVSGHYYRLGYAIEDTSRDVKVDVSLRDKPRGWKVLYGDTFAAEQDYVELKSAERDIAHKAMLIYGQTYRDDLAATWSYGFYRNPDGGLRVPIVGEAPVTDWPKDGFEFGFVVLDKDKSLLDITTSTISKPPKDQETLRFYDVMLTNTQPAYVRTSLRNMDNGDLTFFEYEINESRLPKDDTMRVSDIVMAINQERKPLAINQIRYLSAKQATEIEKSQTRSKRKRDKIEGPSDLTIKRAELDPFDLGDRFFSPIPSPYIFQPGPAFFMFHIENPPADTPKQIQFLVKAQAGALKVPGRVGTEFMSNDGNLHVQGALNLADLPDGAYMLWVRAVYQGREPVLNGVPFLIDRDGQF